MFERNDKASDGERSFRIELPSVVTRAFLRRLLSRFRGGRGPQGAIDVQRVRPGRRLCPLTGQTAAPGRTSAIRDGAEYIFPRSRAR